MATQTEQAIAPPPAPAHGVRAAVARALIHRGHGEPGAGYRLVSIAIAAAIGLSVALALIGTLPDLEPRMHDWLFRLRWIAAAISGAGYLARLWAAGAVGPAGPAGAAPPAVAYAGSFYGVVDLVSALPLWADYAFGLNDDWAAFIALIQVLKLARYAPGIDLVASVVRNEGKSLAAALLAVTILLLFASGLMYVIEHQAQPQAFASIPHAMWWGIVTIASVGYGDIVPQTPVGKLIGGVVIFAGISMFAVPAGILASGFAAELRRRELMVSWESVAEMPLFQGLDANRVGQIARLLKRQVIPANSVIVRRGEKADAMFFIVSGLVEVDIPPRPVRLGEGQYFGEIALLRDTERTATVSAVEECQLLALEVADFRRLINEHPDLKVRIESIAAERSQARR